MAKPDRVITVEVWIHAESDAALKVSAQDGTSEKVWVPKSQCEIDSETRQGRERAAQMTMPYWLAEERGLA